MTHALILDDNPRNVSVLAGLLEMEGITSTQITHPNLLNDTLAGLAALDIIFLDLEMPGLNGYEVLALLQADTHLSKIPVVAYTVHVSEINTAYNLGFHSFIGKPINPDRFPDQIARILSGEPVWEIA